MRLPKKRGLVHSQHSLALVQEKNKRQMALQQVGKSCKANFNISSNVAADEARLEIRRKVSARKTRWRGLDHEAHIFRLPVPA